MRIAHASTVINESIQVLPALRHEAPGNAKNLLEPADSERDPAASHVVSCRWRRLGLNLGLLLGFFAVDILRDGAATGFTWPRCSLCSLVTFASSFARLRRRLRLGRRCWLAIVSAGVTIDKTNLII